MSQTLEKVLEIKRFIQTDEHEHAVVLVERLLEQGANDVMKELILVLTYWINCCIKKKISNDLEDWLLNRILKFVQEINEKDSSTSGTLMELMSESLLDMACGDLSLQQRCSVLHCFNMISALTSRNIRQSHKPKIAGYFFKLGRQLDSLGHYPTQFAALESIIRWTVPRDERSLLSSATYFPTLHPIARTIFVKSKWTDFTQDGRRFLNTINDSKGSVTSELCKRISIGEIEVCTAIESKQTWLDINKTANTLSVILEPSAVYRVAGLRTSSWESLVFDVTSTERASLFSYTPPTMRSDSAKVEITLKMEQPPQLLPSGVRVGTGGDVRIHLSSRTDVESLHESLCMVFGDKYEAENRSLPRPLPPPNFDEINVRARAGATQSSTSTTSLALLPERLKNLPSYGFTKKTSGVCKQPQVSNIQELSDGRTALTSEHQLSRSSRDENVSGHESSSTLFQGIAGAGGAFENRSPLFEHDIHAGDNITAQHALNAGNQPKHTSLNEGKTKQGLSKAKKKCTVICATSNDSDTDVINDTPAYVTSRMNQSNKRNVESQKVVRLDIDAKIARNIPQNMDNIRSPISSKRIDRADSVGRQHNQEHFNRNSKQNEKDRGDKDLDEEETELNTDKRGKVDDRQQDTTAGGQRPRRYRNPLSTVQEQSTPEAINKRKRKLYSPKDALEEKNVPSARNSELNDAFDKLKASETIQVVEKGKKIDVYNYTSGESDDEIFIKKKPEPKRTSKATADNKKPTRSKKSTVRKTGKASSTKAKPVRRSARKANQMQANKIEPVVLEDERMRACKQSNKSNKRQLDDSFTIQKVTTREKSLDYNPSKELRSEIIDATNNPTKIKKRRMSVNQPCQSEQTDRATNNELLEEALSGERSGNSSPLPCLQLELDCQTRKHVFSDVELNAVDDFAILQALDNEREVTEENNQEHNNSKITNRETGNKGTKQDQSEDSFITKRKRESVEKKKRTRAVSEIEDDESYSFGTHSTSAARTHNTSGTQTHNTSGTQKHNNSATQTDSLLLDVEKTSAATTSKEMKERMHPLEVEVVTSFNEPPTHQCITPAVQENRVSAIIAKIANLQENLTNVLKITDTTQLLLQELENLKLQHTLDMRVVGLLLENINERWDKSLERVNKHIENITQHNSRISLTHFKEDMQQIINSLSELKEVESGG